MNRSPISSGAITSGDHDLCVGGHPRITSGRLSGPVDLELGSAL